MSERTDEWRTKPCGCRLQKSLYKRAHRKDGPPLEIWVIREMCDQHEEEHREVMRMLAEGGHIEGYEDD